MGLSTGSTLALYLSVFLSCVSFAIIMPSIWPYMSALHSSKSFLAWVVASYSFGEAFGALSLGYSARFFETQHAMAFAAAIGAAGSVLYMIAGNFPQGGLGLWFVFLGRFAQGVWTGGSQAIQTAYLGKILPVWSLTPTIVTLRASASLGFILGPVFGLALNVFPLSFQASLAAPGGFVLLSALLMAFLFLKVFDEQGDRASLQEEYINTDTNMDLNAPTESDHLLGSIGSKEEYSPGWPDVEEEKLIKGLGICNLTVFSLFAGFAIQETITTPLVEQYYNWTVSSANLLFLGSGLCSLLAFVSVRLLSSRYSDRDMMLWSLSMGTLGCILLISFPSSPLPSWRFLLGFFTISVAFPVGRGTAMALYTKLLPMDLQGTGQGIILAVGAIARILGPFWAVYALTVSIGSIVVFGCAACIFASCFCVAVMNYTALRITPSLIFSEPPSPTHVDAQPI